MSTPADPEPIGDAAAHPAALEPLRSLLFSPGQRQRMVDKALALDVDGVILDLEDGVPPGEKDVARDQVATALRANQGRDRPATLVRVNHAASGRLDGDLQAIVGPGLRAVLLPKVETADEVRDLARRLTELEHAQGLADGTIRIVLAIESARGIAGAVEICGADARVVGVMFGAEDYALDLGLPVQRIAAGMELVYARSAVVVAAAIARIQAYDQVWLNFHDTDGLRAEAITGRHLGFSGKGLIHPSQIDIVNEVFSPSDEDAALATEIVGAFDEARAAGIGAVMLRGQLVELPIVERAHTTLRLYETHRTGTRGSDA